MQLALADLHWPFALQCDTARESSVGRRCFFPTRPEVFRRRICGEPTCLCVYQILYIYIDQDVLHSKTVYVYSIIEGSLEAKLPTTWTDGEAGKQLAAAVSAVAVWRL